MAAAATPTPFDDIDPGAAGATSPSPWRRWRSGCSSFSGSPPGEHQADPSAGALRHLGGRHRQPQPHQRHPRHPQPRSPRIHAHRWLHHGPPHPRGGGAGAHPQFGPFHHDRTVARNLNEPVAAGARLEALTTPETLGSATCSPSSAAVGRRRGGVAGRHPQPPLAWRLLGDRHLRLRRNHPTLRLHPPLLRLHQRRPRLPRGHQLLRQECLVDLRGARLHRLGDEQTEVLQLRTGHASDSGG
jgi:hypothetical protein